MATEAELLQAVLADPDSDEPRRVYMEWAAARGDARADLIRVQLELADALRRNAGVEEWAPFSKAARAYLEIHGALWRQPLEPLGELIASPTFRRGFVEQVTMDADAFAREAPRVYALAPVRHLRLTGAARAPGALASPHLARIVSLDLSATGIDDAVIEALARSPHARKLTWLDISKNKLGRASVDAIAASPHLRALRFVNLVGTGAPNPVEDYGTEGMAIVSTSENELGRELERAHGRLAWLHAPSEFGDGFPPDPDATAPY
jgi:uncharacterized protein (TIGR02996 family)